MPPRHVLLTGKPGTGKTTAFLAAVAELQRHVASDATPRFASVTGFVTRERRGDGPRAARIGFDLETIPDGLAASLARVPEHAPAGCPPGAPRVGKYVVTVNAVENVAVPTMLPRRARPQGKPSLIVVDEIGKMECLCPAFIDALRRALDDPTAIVVATVAAVGGGAIADVKRRTDVSLLTLTHDTRDDMPRAIVDRVLQVAAASDAPHDAAA